MLMHMHMHMHTCTYGVLVWVYCSTNRKNTANPLGPQIEITENPLGPQIEITANPLGMNFAPHTLPDTLCPAHPHLALGGGCLSRGRCGENPRVHRTAPSDGSGEPARAWSLAWDMVVADPCNGFQPGRCPVFPDGIPIGTVAAQTR